MVSNLLSTRAIRVLGDRIDPYYPNIFSVAATGLLVVILLGTTRERFTYAGFAQVTFARENHEIGIEWTGMLVECNGHLRGIAALTCAHDGYEIVKRVV